MSLDSVLDHTATTAPYLSTIASIGIGGPERIDAILAKLFDRARPPVAPARGGLAPWQALRVCLDFAAKGRKVPMNRILCCLLGATLAFGSALADSPKERNAKVTLVYQHELPNVPGKSIKGVLVEYGPGGYSRGHTHAKSAFIYATVLEGAIKSQVNDGPLTTYEAGQSFSELPGDRHVVSANASKTKPAKLLAVFVVNTSETQLTTPFGS